MDWSDVLGIQQIDSQFMSPLLGVNYPNLSTYQGCEPQILEFQAVLN